MGFRFAVFFMTGGVAPNPIDIRFQRVSGLSSTVETQTVNEGGENLYVHRLPKRVTYGNLLLERGVVFRSPLELEFNAAMSLFKFKPSNAVVTLFGDDGLPLKAWLFLKAYPVRWSSGDLNANDGTHSQRC